MYRVIDRVKMRVNALLDNALVSHREEEAPRIEREVIQREKQPKERKEHLKSPEEIVRDVIGGPERMENLPTESSTDANPQQTRNERLKSEFDNPEKEQHESRQNIVHNAKINTENIKTSLQNVKDQFEQSVNKLKDVKDNIQHNIQENIDTFNDKSKGRQENVSYKQPSSETEINQQNFANAPQNYANPQYNQTVNANLKPQGEQYQDTFTKTNDKYPPVQPDIYQKKIQ